MRQPRGLLGGIALLCGGMGALFVALARVHSAVFGQHVALLLGPLALLGCAVGAAAFSLKAPPVRSELFIARAAELASLAAGGAVLALLFAFHTDAAKALTLVDVALLGVVTVAATLPFAFAGAAVSAATRYDDVEPGSVLGFAFGGLALGLVAGVASLRIGAPRAILASAILDALAGVVLYTVAPRIGNEHLGDGHLFGDGNTSRSLWPGLPGKEPVALERPVRGGFVATLMLATLTLLAGDLGAPWLKLPALRWAALDKVEHQEWTPSGLVTLDRFQGGLEWMRADGTAASQIPDPKVSLPGQIDEVALFFQRDPGPLLALGTGAGRDLRAMLRNGRREIWSVTSNAHLARELFEGAVASWIAEMPERTEKPEVHLVAGDERSFLRTTPLRFPVILLPLVDDSAAAPSGALEVQPTPLFTVEAFRQYVERLTPTGILLVTRPDDELARTVALATGGLRAAGIDAPEKHQMACGSGAGTALIVSRAPFTAESLMTLRVQCRKNRFSELMAPDQLSSELKRALGLHDDGPEPLPPPTLSIATDDRPFAGYTLRARELPKLLRARKDFATQHAALAALLASVLLSVVLGAVLLIGSFVVGRKEARWLGPRWGFAVVRAAGFFVAAGVGFAGLARGVSYELGRLGGWSDAASSAMLAGLLLWAAVGSHASADASPRAAASWASRCAQLLAVLLAFAAVGLDVGGGKLAVLPLGGRVILAALATGGLGLAFGAGLQLASKLVTAHTVRLLPWCLALGATATAGAISGGSFIAVQWGFTALFLASGASFLVASALVLDAPEA